MSAGRSWYETGYQGAEREQERKDLGNAPQRFWMRPQATREIIFVDDIPFCYWEHSWKEGESRNNFYATCISKISADGCFGCGARGVQRAEYLGQYTIVDVTGYVSKKDGKEHKYELNLYPAKTKVLNKLKLKKEKKGSLTQILWTVGRGDEHSPNTGDDFDAVREITDMSKVYELVTYKGKKIKDLIDTANAGGAEAAKVRKFLAHNFQIPDQGEIPARIPVFNYPNLFEPMESGAMRSAMAGATGFGSKSSGSTGSSSATADDVPF